MKKCLIGIVLAMPAPHAAAAEFPVQVSQTEEPCIDAPPGKQYQLECVQKYNGEVKPISARLCKLPDGTWILNFRWRCIDKPAKK